MSKQRTVSSYEKLAKQLALDPYQIYEVDLTGTFESFRTYFYSTVKRVREEMALKNCPYEYGILSSRISVSKLHGGRTARVYIQAYMDFQSIRDTVEEEKDEDN